MTQKKHLKTSVKPWNSHYIPVLPILNTHKNPSFRKGFGATKRSCSNIWGMGLFPWDFRDTTKSLRKSPWDHDIPILFWSTNPWSVSYAIQETFKLKSHLGSSRCWPSRRRILGGAAELVLEEMGWALGSGRPPNLGYGVIELLASRFESSDLPLHWLHRSTARSRLCFALLAGGRGIVRTIWSVVQLCPARHTLRPGAVLVGSVHWPSPSHCLAPVSCWYRWYPLVLSLSACLLCTLPRKLKKSSSSLFDLLQLSLACSSSAIKSLSIWDIIIPYGRSSTMIPTKSLLI